MILFRFLCLGFGISIAVNVAAQEDEKYNEETRKTYLSNKVTVRKITRVGQDGSAPFAMIEYLNKEGRPVSTLLHNIAFDRISKVDSTIYQKGFISKKIFFANEASDSVLYEHNPYGVLQKELHFKDGNIIQERTFFYSAEKIRKEVIRYNPSTEIVPVINTFIKKDSINYEYAGDTVITRAEPSGESTKFIIRQNRNGYIESVLNFCEVRKDPCRKKFLEYNKANKLLRKKEFDDSSLLFRYVYFYNRKGLCVKEEIYTPGNDLPVTTILFDYLYQE